MATLQLQSMNRVFTIQRSPTIPEGLPSNGAPIPLTRKHLRLCASWIRDDLDPLVAREGPDVLNPDDVLTLHELFLTLATDATDDSLPGLPSSSRVPSEVNKNTLRYSRIHWAVLEIAGKATRWPGRLADECDLLIQLWTLKFGNIHMLRPVLFGMSGRLTGISGTGDSTREGLLKLWSLSCPDRLLPARSRKHGDLGFPPGSWWINGMFACHAGIIDLDVTEGGICCDEKGAYAVVIKDNAEINSPSPLDFTYRCKSQDKGRYRLTSANFRSRYPIRILRSHSLNALWAPKVGLRYDGLHRVTGWSIKGSKPKTGEGMEYHYEVTFRREEDQLSMGEVLRHPLADEVDDYMEYKRLRHGRPDIPTEVSKIGETVGWSTGTESPEPDLVVASSRSKTSAEVPLSNRRAASADGRASKRSSMKSVHARRQGNFESDKSKLKLPHIDSLIPSFGSTSASSSIPTTSVPNVDISDRSSLEVPGQGWSKILGSAPVLKTSDDKKARRPRGSVLAVPRVGAPRPGTKLGSRRKSSIFTKLMDGAIELSDIDDEVDISPEDWEIVSLP